MRLKDLPDRRDVAGCPQCGGATETDYHARKGDPRDERAEPQPARVIYCTGCEWVKEF